jgi:acyl carrier protein
MSDVGSVSTRTQTIQQIVDALLTRKKTPGLVRVDEDLHDRGLTSLDMVNLMLAVEDEFGIEFPQDEMTPENFRTISAIDHLVSRIAG